ncbi:sulfotransferase family 2 domain-containing protein [Paracoccus sp. 1_MG-2023]|uniref:sulfotransferase family 2 domain-containing protein n=1 Tax=unclassified Paracoccus (in: a-proteobacteria) TaxID=2688777 RepID=UPI001C09ADEA|nr:MULTISPECIES: sulfotransferase family 2 domain-containing protein [unclassified Paracoccus (in: a-proteobacteria)]MBU2958921.1 sulfotransferase family protein [Paracoccus sp. C2R09]MDO6669989.1 sulfotransferase family 2 domain-containing protein [Paracoccus sp. 1_MG-2023]
MIISQRHEFVFVHIPKCAGTSVRTQLVKCDPDHVAMAEVGEHPVLGKIDFGHVPLSKLRAHFPENYDALERFTSYAVVRDPLARFGSSLRQMLWRYSNRPMTLIPPEELRELTLKMLDDIAAELDDPSNQFIFFARQRDFIYDGDRRMVDHLIPMELVPDFIAHVSRITDTPMEAATRSNQNVELRFKRFGGMAYRVNDVLRRSLPLDMHAKIKDGALRLLSAKKSAAEASGILEMDEVRDFVRTHYAEDARIHHEVKADTDRLRAALQADSLTA